MGTTRFQWDPRESHGNGNRNTGFLFKQYNSSKFKREWEGQGMGIVSRNKWEWDNNIRYPSDLEWEWE